METSSALLSLCYGNLVGWLVDLMQGFDVFFAGQALEEIDKLPVILYAMKRM